MVPSRVMKYCRCAIPSCPNYNSKTRVSDKSIKGHLFPKNPEVRLQWINACQLADQFNLDKSYICSEHFLETDYVRDLKAELMNLPPKKILKPDSVPSLNLNKSTRLVGDSSDILRKSKSESLDASKENKENSGEITDPKGACNGFIISCLGSQKLLITSNSKNVDDHSRITGNSSQSKIASVDSEVLPDDFQEQGITPMDAFGEPLTGKQVFKLVQLCRLCGCYSSRMKSIFETNGQICYAEIINSHFPEIKVHKNDLLPVQICSRCELNLVTWYQFFRTCNSVNKRFQSMLKKLSPIQDIGEFDKSELLKEDSNKSFFQTMDVQDESNDECDAMFDEDSIKEIEIVEISPEVEETDTVDVFPEKKSVTIASIDVPKKIDPEVAFEPVEEKYLIPEDVDVDLKEENVSERISSKECDTSEISEQFLEKLQRSPRLTRVKREILKGAARRRKRRRMPTLNLRRMCHICGKIFKYPESLRRHLKTVHSDERPFKCHLCTSSFNRNHNLTIHIKVVHQHQRVYVKKHVQRLCDYCGKVLLSARSLEEHISSIHTKKALYECNKCHSTFYRKLTFDKHRTSDECDSENPKKCNAPKNEEVFLKYCEFCGLEFKKEHFYTKHKLKHMNNFVCSVCSVNFEDGNLLKEHVDTEHPEMKPFECEVCGKKFKNKPLLNCHLVIHTGEKRYQCQYCSLKFLKKKYLSTHILTHTGERPFVCTICGKGFKQSGDMRKHKATHIRRQI